MGKYLALLLVGCGVFGIFLNLNKQRFNEDKLWQMVEGKGRQTNWTSDYCKFLTGLDPKEPDQRYVKIRFVCGGREVRNTLSWVTIEDKTVGGVINMIKNINGIKNDNADLDCDVDGRKSVISDQLSVGNLITCKID